MFIRSALAVQLAIFVAACNDGAPATTGTDTDGTGSTGTDSLGTIGPGTTTGSDTGGTVSTIGVTDSGSGSSSGGTGPKQCPLIGEPIPMFEGCPCDPFAPNCEAGLKCNPVATGTQNVWNSNECVPLDPNPKAVGEPCSTPDGPSAGIDDCDVGAMCWDVDTSNNTGTCVEICGGTAQQPVCSTAQNACSRSNAGALNLCLPLCDPLNPTCAAGEGCYPEPNGFFCTQHAGSMGAYGEPCEFLNVCDPGSWCADTTAVPGCNAAFGCCTPICDVTAPNACPDLATGQICVPFYKTGMAPTGYENVGYCGV